MENLIVFKNSNFGELKVFLQNDGIMFNAYDVAKCLGNKHPEEEVSANCKNPLISCCKNTEEIKKFIYIHEKDLNEYLLSMSNSVSLNEWIQNEVIPSVKKNYIYSKKEIIKYINYLI